MTPYERPDRGWCGNPARGAAMGRGSDPASAFEGKKVHLRRVPMVDGDYDPGGTYWGGGGTPLWCAWDTDTDVEIFFRAKNRQSAKGQLPGARFYR